MPAGAAAPDGHVAEPSTLADLAPRAALLHGGGSFLVLWSASRPPRHLSFDAFARWTASASDHVRRLLPPATRRGARVAMLAHASADSLALSLAVPSNGAVLVQLNWRQPEAALAAMLSGLGCCLLIAGSGFAAVARRLRERSGVPALVLIDGAANEEPHPGMPGESSASCDPADGDAAGSPALAAEEGEAPSDAPVSIRPAATDVAAVMFTSGTSALPKPVPLTHGGLLWSCRAKQAAELEVLGIGGPDGAAHRGTLAFLPAFHVIGFTNNFLYNLYAGVRCMVHADAPRVPLGGSLLLRACSELRPSILDTVPALLSSLAGEIPAGQRGGGGGGAAGGTGGLFICESDAATLRSCAAVLYGGAALAADVAEVLSGSGVALYSQYGQTELGGMALMGAPGGAPGTLRPVGGISVRLDQPTGAARDALKGGGGGEDEGEQSASGELVLSGVGSLTPGYWQLDGEVPLSIHAPSRAPTPVAARAERGGADGGEWATGDVFEPLPGGWIRHVCRRDELLLHTSGEMTNPAAVESTIAASLKRAGVPLADCCVFGAGRPVPALVIELREHAPLLASADVADGMADDVVDDVSPGENGGTERDGSGDRAGECDGVPLVQLSCDLHSPQSLREVLLGALDDAASEIASYSFPPAGLVILVHAAQHEPLLRTAKGGIVRSSVERRFATFVDEALRRSAAASTKQPGSANGGRTEEGGKAGGSGADGVGPSVGPWRGEAQRPPSPRAVHGDSLGLASLVRGGGSGGGGGGVLSKSEAAADALVQHLKVFLLFAVLLRHLQRFTVKTCHAWAKVPPNHLGICIANNVLQTGAAEGLAFLSGVAMAGRQITMRDVVSPLVLIVLFRQLLHPLLEWCFSYHAEIGTAHLWFVMMIGFGRLVCLPLSRLPRRAHTLRVSLVGALFVWRLLLAPTHIGWHSMPIIRRPLFFLLFGDRNYLQIVHNLPLLMIGFVHADIAFLARARLASLPPVVERLRRRLLNCCACCAPTRPQARRALVGGTIVLASFVADPIWCGFFIKKIKLLEERPLVVYARSALRVGALAAVLPRRRTPLTAAGRSQLLAYLLHDACFSVGAQVIVPAIGPPSLSALALGRGSALDGGGGEAGALRSALVAAAELTVYAACCLAVQLALSHPNGCLLGWRRSLCCDRGLSKLLPGLYSRLRLAVRSRLGTARRVASEDAAV